MAKDVPPLRAWVKTIHNDMVETWEAPQHYVLYVPAKGNWHGLYAMAFKDSYNKWEPIAGYGWEKTWRPLADDNLHLGLGFTAAVTARDNWNYIPIPLVLPLASVGYGPATFQMTYIPGTYNNGNVYFAWMRFQF